MFIKYLPLHQRTWPKMQKLQLTDMAMECLSRHPMSSSLKSVECKGRHGAKPSELMISTMKWLSLVCLQLQNEHGIGQVGSWTDLQVWPLMLPLVSFQRMSYQLTIMFFLSALGCKEAFKLEMLGIAYRVPPPSASINASDVLTANSEIPWTTIMYSTDGGNTWSEYSGPVVVGAGKIVSLQSVSSHGDLKS